MLDCHIIVSADTRREWVLQCLLSVRAAVSQAGYLVRVHLVRGTPGHIGAGRAAGYARGAQPYVTCVDDDDYVLLDAFANMRGALESGVSAVCTPEFTMQNGHIREGGARHHLIAYRRSAVIDHAAWPCCGDVAQIVSLAADTVDLPRPAYVHRVYMNSKARVMRRSRKKELESARG